MTTSSTVTLYVESRQGYMNIDYTATSNRSVIEVTKGGGTSVTTITIKSASYDGSGTITLVQEESGYTITINVAVSKHGAIKQSLTGYFLLPFGYDFGSIMDRSLTLTTFNTGVSDQQGYYGANGRWFVFQGTIDIYQDKWLDTRKISAVTTNEQGLISNCKANVEGDTTFSTSNFYATEASGSVNQSYVYVTLNGWVPGSATVGGYYGSEEFQKITWTIVQG